MVLFSLSASARAVAPTSPMLFTLKSNVVMVVFSLSAFARAVAPSPLMWSEANIKEVMVVCFASAAAKTVMPIELLDKFNVVSVVYFKRMRKFSSLFCV